jgi:hypothetical protein
MADKRTRSKPEVFFMRVGKGCFEPADGYARDRLRARGYRMGDVVGCTFKKLNNPGFHRLIHRIGQLCAANIEAFRGMDAHAVLKRLQWEANIACEEIGVVVPGVGMAMMRFPKSLSFDSMDDGERHEAARAMCRHIAQKYWPTMDAEAIEEMAESFVEEG